MDMTPETAQALAVVAPFVVALLTKANASDTVKSAVSVAIIVGLSLWTWYGRNNPDDVAGWTAFAGSLAAIIIGSYKTVDALIPTGLGSVTAPDRGIG